MHQNNLSPYSPVITGYGCITALGKDLKTSWEKILKGEQSRQVITLFDTSGCRVREAAQITSLDIPNYSKKFRLSRGLYLLIEAASEALEMSGLLGHNQKTIIQSLDLCISTTAAGMEKREKFFHSMQNKNFFQIISLISSYQAEQQINFLQNFLGFSGSSVILSNACASGANAIAHAADLIRAGITDRVLTGGYDALCDLVFTGFDSLQILATKQCSVFEKEPTGLMLGEGSGCLVLESMETAQKRSAKIYGYLASYGHTVDISHLTLPDQTGKPLQLAIQVALKEANLNPDDIGYVNAHGTGTALNDRAELNAFHHVFQKTSTKISSTKPAHGHTLGAAGAIEAIIVLQALNTGKLPPHIHQINPEECIKQSLVQLNMTSQLDAVMSLNSGFGGSNVALLFKKYYDN